METPANDHPTSPRVSLLLAGRIGHGKSSTGNSILGKKEFTPMNSYKPVTLDTIKRALSNDKSLEVVDAFDIADDISEKDEFVFKMREHLFSINLDGFSALLIVLKFGIRFTNQEQHAIKMIKSYFGQDVMKTHGIVVMTHGDNFELDFPDVDMSFENWCSEQTGNIRLLFEETGGRWFLFDNKTKDEMKKEKQVKQLLNKVEEIEKNSGRISMLDIHKEMNEILKRLGKNNKEILEQLKKLRDKLNSQENITGIKKSDIEDYRKIIDNKIQQMERRCKEGKQNTCKETGASSQPDVTIDSSNNDVVSEENQPDVTNDPSNNDFVSEENQPDVTSDLSNNDVLTEENQPEVTSDLSNNDVVSEENQPDVTNDSSNNDFVSEENQPDVTSDPSNNDVLTEESQPDVTSDLSNNDVVSEENQPDVTNDPSNNDFVSEENQPDFTSDPSNNDVLTEESQPDVTNDPSYNDVISEENQPDVTTENEYSDFLSTSVTLDIHKEVGEILERLKKNNEEIMGQLKKLRYKLNSQEHETVIRKPDTEDYNKKIIDKQIQQMERWCKEDTDTIKECNGVKGKQNEEGTSSGGPKSFLRKCTSFLSGITNFRGNKRAHLTSEISNNDAVSDENRSLGNNDPSNNDLASGANSALASGFPDDLKDQPVRDSGDSDKAESKISLTSDGGAQSTENIGMKSPEQGAEFFSGKSCGIVSSNQFVTKII